MTEHQISNQDVVGSGTSAPSDGELLFTRPYTGHNGARSGKLTEGERVIFSGYIPRDADAAKIVTRWNAHTPLVEALRVLLADCEDYEPWQRPCRAVDLARAALAKARGQS